MAVIERIQYQDVEGIRVGKFTSRISTTCTVYRIENTLIDTGPPNQWPWVREFLAEKEISQVLITHHHEDHSGNGASIQKEIQIPIKGPPSSKPYIERGFRIQLYRKVIWGRPKTFLLQSISDDLALKGGLKIQPIHTPGHSTDMTCYLIPERGWLFTGDLYITSKPKYLRKDENPKLEIESLKKILQFKFEVVFCAHRGVIEAGRQALQEKLDFLQALTAKVMHLHNEGRSIGQITHWLLGKEDMLSWLTYFHFSKRNLVKALLPEAN